MFYTIGAHGFVHISYREPFGETIRVPEDDEQFKLAEDEFIQAKKPKEAIDIYIYICITHMSICVYIYIYI